LRFAICCAALLAVSAPARAQDTEDILAACLDRFRAENGLPATDDLSNVQAGVTYSLYGRPYQLIASGPAIGICKQAEFDQLGTRLSASERARRSTVEELRLERVRVDGLERKLDRFERPVDTDIPYVTPALSWLNVNGLPGWGLFSFLFVFLTVRVAMDTPWYRNWRDRKRAQHHLRPLSPRSRPPRRTYWKRYRKPWPRWVKPVLFGPLTLLFVLVLGIACS